MLFATISLYAVVDVISPSPLEFQVIAKAAKDTQGWDKPRCNQLVTEASLATALIPLIIYHILAIVSTYFQPYNQKINWYGGTTIS